jgi:hypothetical protein
LTFERSVPPLGSESVALPVGAATMASMPAEFESPNVSVDALVVPIWNAAPLCERVSCERTTASGKLRSGGMVLF